ncbi:hypothetical protein CBL_12655 [Carabus blaptoides fortunei]
MNLTEPCTRHGQAMCERETADRKRGTHPLAEGGPSTDLSIPALRPRSVSAAKHKRTAAAKVSRTKDTHRTCLATSCYCNRTITRGCKPYLCTRRNSGRPRSNVANVTEQFENYFQTLQTPKK